MSSSSDAVVAAAGFRRGKGRLFGHRQARYLMRLIRAQFLLVTLAVAAAIALAACSTIDPPNNDLLTSSIAPSTVRKTICVVAAIGDTFSVQKIGVTAFGNALDKHSIDAWGIDSAVASKISTRLSPRFDVRRIDYPVGTFLPVEQVKSVLSSDYKDHRRSEERRVGKEGRYGGST